MISKLFLTTLIMFVFIEGNGQIDHDNVYRGFRYLSINSINISVASETQLFRHTNNTDLLYDSSGYLKSALYHFSSFNRFTRRAQLDSFSMLRSYCYNKTYSYFASEQLVNCITIDGNWYGYKNEKSFGAIDKDRNTVLKYEAADAIGYTKIDSLIQTWNNVNSVVEQKPASEGNDVEYAKKQTVDGYKKGAFQAEHGGWPNLLDSRGSPVRCYLLLNLLTDEKRFYVPVIDTRLFIVRNDWLPYIDTMSSFLSLNETSDYSHFGEDIGKAKTSLLSNISIGYNGKVLKLEFNQEQKINRALVEAWDSNSEYYYKYATYEYLGDSLIRINSYELPFNRTHEYITYQWFEDISKLRKIRGCKEAVEELRFEHGKLVAYEKKYLKGKGKEICLFSYDSSLGLLTKVDHKIFVNHKPGLQEYFTLQFRYK